MNHFPGKFSFRRADPGREKQLSFSGETREVFLPIKMNSVTTEKVADF